MDFMGNRCIVLHHHVAASQMWLGKADDVVAFLWTGQQENNKRTHNFGIAAFCTLCGFTEARQSQAYIYLLTYRVCF
jgi:hypothetical protein